MLICQVILKEGNALMTLGVPGYQNGEGVSYVFILLLKIDYMTLSEILVLVDGFSLNYFCFWIF